MSTFIREIIEDIDNHPEKWSVRQYVGQIMALSDNNGIVIYSYGNCVLTSIVKVEIRHVIMTTTFIDRARLELAIQRWFKSIPLFHLTRK